MQANPLLQASTLPYQLPPFDLVDNQHYREAFAAGMTAQLREIAAITAQDTAAAADGTADSGLAPHGHLFTTTPAGSWPSTMG